MNKLTVVSVNDFKIVSKADDSDPSLMLLLAEFYEYVWATEIKAQVDKAICDAVMYGYGEVRIGYEK